MKRTLAFLASLVLACGLSAQAQTYPGNGATGFGGVLGNGSLSITNDASGLITFNLTTGTTFNENAIVLFIDSTAGGFSDTATFTDVSDPGRRAISGLSDSGRTLATFASGFTGDYAIAIEPTFAGLFQLTSGGMHNFVTNANISGSGTSFSFSISATNIGLTVDNGQAFNFVASLISTTAYRSNETIGTSVTMPGSSSDGQNAGFTGTVTYSDFGTYSLTAIPEPSTVSLLAASAIFGGCLYARRRRGA